MQEVIDSLLREEADAQKKIQESEEKARELKSRVESDYSQKIASAREEARKHIQQSVEKARVEILARQRQARSEAEARSDSLWDDKQSLIDGVTDEVISYLITPEYEKE